MNPQPGEVWLADLGLAAKTRPVVVVSRQDPNPPRSLVIYVPLTTQNRHSMYEVPIARLKARQTPHPSFSGDKERHCLGTRP
jgi:mRNA interferase MazF